MGKSPPIVNVTVSKKKKKQKGKKLILQKKIFVSYLAIHKCLNLFHNSPKGYISWNKETEWKEKQTDVKHKHL